VLNIERVFDFGELIRAFFLRILKPDSGLRRMLPLLLLPPPPSPSPTHPDDVTGRLRLSA
jgi:hypothetical protein